MRIGVIDIGTNSTRLLVTETAGGPLRVIGRELNSTRLGEGMAAGVLADRAVDRTIDVLRQYTVEACRLRADRVAAVATSAVRDAANRDLFLQRVKEQTGLDVRVLSGSEEARMSFLGVVRGLDVSLEGALVIDVGGGSTEFIWRKGAGEVFYRSVRAGAVRMTEGSYGQSEIREVFAPVFGEISMVAPRSLVGVGGTVTTLAAVAQALSPYDPEKVHGYFLSREKVSEILKDLAAKTPEERHRVTGLQPERADIIVAGVQIVAVIMKELKLPGITAGETDIMYGVTYDLLEKTNS